MTAVRVKPPRAYRCAWWGCSTPAPSAGRLCARHLAQRIEAATRPTGPLRRLLPARARRTTPCAAECELLMGFPLGWTCLHDHPQPCDCADGPRYKACGNAVVVDVAEWLLGRVVEVLGRGAHT